MRRLIALLGLIGLFAAPALADVTVRYKVKNQAEKAITISVAGNGNARFDSGEGGILIARDGQRYFVARDPQGPMVARVEDGLTVLAEFAAALMEMMEAMAAASSEQGSAPQSGLVQMQAAALAPYRIEERGPETVGGRSGRLFLISAEAAGQGPTLEVVISTDADLAPVGRELRTLLGLAGWPAATLFGQTPDILIKLEEVLARGTPIRIGEQFRLDGVSAEPVPASSFELPGPVLTLEQLRARSPLNALAARTSAESGANASEADANPDPDPDDE